MQAERMKMVESVRRNTSVEENLSLFESLLKGEVAAQKFCLRAKIDMSSVNGTMRDPVLYRFNENPHHRTGTKFKAYPTYDFGKYLGGELIIAICVGLNNSHVLSAKFI